jgi:hypothetical protein
MKRKFFTLSVIAVVLFTGNHVYGQSESEQQVYLGLGMGVDYGGLIGGKIEYLPIKNVGVFGGLGFNLLSVGWNVGATYKITPDKKVSPNLMAFYGYNAVLKIEGASSYNTTSYGPTFGGNVDIKMGNGSKLSIGLFVPIRSKKFNDQYDAAKKNPNMFLRQGLLLCHDLGYGVLE